MNEIKIKIASPSDAELLLGIYAPYIRETAVTFEYIVPSVEEFAQRISHTLEKYPYLMAVKNGEILGYVYAGPLHPRAAYAWSVETSIYVKKDKKQLGVGRILYDALEQVLKAGLTSASGRARRPWEFIVVRDKDSFLHTNLGLH